VLWVTGDVTWTDSDAIDAVMTEWLRPGGIVLTGGAKGADSLAVALAAKHQCFVVTVPYYGPGGRAGGPMRNELMAEMCDELHGLRYEVRVAGFGTGSGTRDSIKRAIAHGLTTGMNG
jgi:hypothetical protein